MGAMITIFAITNGTDGQDDMHLRILGMKHIDGLLQIVGTCIDRAAAFAANGVADPAIRMRRKGECKE